MNAAGVALLKDFEGFERQVAGEPGVAVAYWDHLGKVWTGPYGFTRGVREGDRWTREQADERLADEVAEYERAVRDACRVLPSDNQVAAMTCLAWNIGITGFLRSTVLKAHNRADFEAAARAFGLWNRAGGREVRGLTRRRAAEADLYLRASGVHAFAEPMPQRVDAESGARHSPIVWGAGISGSAGALTVLSDISRTLGDVRFALGEWFPWLLLALVVGGAAWAIVSRIRQRRGGWA
jgi:lysozyme